MRFPFVSRDRYDEMQTALSARIEKLEQDLADVQHDRKIILDRLVWGYSQGVQLYKDTPRIVEIEPEPNQRSRSPTTPMSRRS
jgi:hypothetical protein